MLIDIMLIVGVITLAWYSFHLHVKHTALVKATYGLLHAVETHQSMLHFLTPMVEEWEQRVQAKATEEVTA